MKSWSTGKVRQGISGCGLTRPFAKDKNPGKICLPIVETTTEKAIRAMGEGQAVWLTLIELRVDYMKNPRLENSLEGGREALHRHQPPEGRRGQVPGR